VTTKITNADIRLSWNKSININTGKIKILPLFIELLKRMAV